MSASIQEWNPGRAPMLYAQVQIPFYLTDGSSNQTYDPNYLRISATMVTVLGLSRISSMR